MVLRERKVKEDDEPATEGELMDIDGEYGALKGVT
jgi:hypothetical protein